MGREDATELKEAIEWAKANNLKVVIYDHPVRPSQFVIAVWPEGIPSVAIAGQFIGSFNGAAWLRRQTTDFNSWR